MSEKTPKELEAEARAARLAEALRANLHRRKGQKRARAAAPPAAQDAAGGGAGGEAGDGQARAGAAEKTSDQG